MPYKYRFLSDFSDSLAEIAAYLSDIAPIYSERFLEDLTRQIKALADLPYIYATYGQDERFRKMSMNDWKYAVFYIVDEENQEIIFYDVLHMSRDIPTYLRKH